MANGELAEEQGASDLEPAVALAQWRERLDIASSALGLRFVKLPQRFSWAAAIRFRTAADTLRLARGAGEFE